MDAFHHLNLSQVLKQHLLVKKVSIVNYIALTNLDKFYQNYLVEYMSFKWEKINDGAVDLK